MLDPILQAAYQFLDRQRQALARFIQPMVTMLPTATLCKNALAVNNTTSALIQILWPWDGYLVGISATTEDGLIASMAGAQLRVLVNGVEDLFTDVAGSGGDFVNFSVVTGLYTGGMFPWIRPFRAGVPWQFQIKTNGNYTTDTFFHAVRLSANG